MTVQGFLPYKLYTEFLNGANGIAEPCYLRGNVLQTALHDPLSETGTPSCQNILYQ
jgi:hypothetical protein